MKNLADVNMQLSQKIVDIVEFGNVYQDSDAFEAALEKYSEAWAMLPDPIEQWDLSHWIASCKSELYLKQADYESAKSWALIAVESKPPRETSSLIILGASYLGLNERESAYEFFKQAFELGKERAFQGFNKSYLDFLTGYQENK